MLSDKPGRRRLRLFSAPIRASLRPKRVNLLVLMVRMSGFAGISWWRFPGSGI
jgi:hypothetical protein